MHQTCPAETGTSIILNEIYPEMFYHMCHSLALHLMPLMANKILNFRNRESNPSSNTHYIAMSFLSSCTTATTIATVKMLTDPRISQLDNPLNKG